MADTSPPSLEWSAQYTLAHSRRGQPLSGDKIKLSQSALEGLLSAASNAAAADSRRDLPAYDPYNSATYSAYRQAESQYQDQRQQLPYPLTFRLVNPANGRVVYAGVREFSAEEGEVELSPFLQEGLGLKEREEDRKAANDTIVDGESPEKDTPVSTITVHAKQLPKGTFVKLRPLEPGYDPEDWKALLEQSLRSGYTTLTNGEVIGIEHGRERLRFLVDGFQQEQMDGVCIVDTDLEVDIEALNEEQARETLKRIAEKMTRLPGSEHGSSAGGELDLFKAQQGQVLPGEYVDFTLNSWNRTQPLEIELNGNDGEEDVDLLISPFSASQRAKPRIDEFVFGDIDSRPRKRIRLDPSNAELEHAEALYVSVHAFAPAQIEANGDHQEASPQPRHFTLRASHPDPATSVDDSQGGTETTHQPDEIQCKNCLQFVPKARLVLHEAFCFRNNVLCPHGCNQVFQKSSAEYQNHWHCPHDTANGDSAMSRSKHDTVFHPAPLRCSCGTQETFSSYLTLARHRTSTCPEKQILCRFCHLEVPQGGDPDVPNAEAILSGMTPHELEDGARTTECHVCSKLIRLRDTQNHMKVHDLDRLSRPAPVLCRNPNCGRTLFVCSKAGDTRAGEKQGQGPGNDVGLCSACFGPLYVSMYDPENKALRRRVERRYLSQLTQGCKKAWCRNEYCASGRKNLGIAGSITTKDALPMIKPFLDGMMKGSEGSPLHFCVDEGSQRRRQLAEMLAAEEDPPGKGGYGLTWCVGALEAASGSLDGAREWLKNFAPVRGEERGR
ncbi:uncharacterized protein LTR77_005888 [Saxophila tyrrhenica]|uniref:Ubiquitin-protein ligase E3A N-terminal zinc-binding domain-containing protein n=1 Tax=Saxophila tyrrhenica TaxID=1690608 RepID=A0AAV9PDV3_9PEZI|nr:hypothetical protein LTR77_005888 [Saxophila tyrrhenica]